MCRTTPTTTSPATTRFPDRELTKPSSTGSPRPAQQGLLLYQSRKPSQPGLPLGKPCLSAELVADGFTGGMGMGQIVHKEQTGQLRPREETPVRVERRIIPPKSPYLCFAEKVREDLGAGWHDARAIPRNEANNNISREVSKRWKALSAEEKQAWQAASQQDLKRYDAECDEAGLEPQRFAHIALRDQVRTVRPDNEGGAGQAGRPRQHAGRAAPHSRPAAYAGARKPAAAVTYAAGGSFALVVPTPKDQPSERTIPRTTGRKWNAASRSYS